MSTRVEATVDVNETNESGEEPAPASDKSRRARQGQWIRRTVLLAVSIVAAWVLVQRETEVREAAHLLLHVDWRLIAIAVLFEAASMVVFARLQRWLLRAGNVNLPLRTMVEITLAGNAISTTLPGGGAWEAAWAFGQLRRRGVDRFLRVWVFLVAGAFSSFALFIVVAVGIEVAGSRGPVADLRWAALGLAAVPVVVLVVAWLRRWDRVHNALERLSAFVDRRLPGGRFVLRIGRQLLERLEAVHLSPLHWAEVLGLALLNWLYDCAVLICAMLALHVGVPWRAIFVIYGLTPIAASLPIPPGGLVVGEGSLAALLTAFGVHAQAARARVVV